MLDPMTIGGWAGIAGSVFSVALIVIAGWMRPGYDPVGLVQRVAFFSFPAWLFAFAIGVPMTAPDTPAPGA